MKKVITTTILSAGLFFLVPTSQAVFRNARPKGGGPTIKNVEKLNLPAKSIAIKQKNKIKLKDSLDYAKWKKEKQHEIENVDKDVYQNYKSIPNQQVRHQNSQKEIGYRGINTFMRRTGKYNYVPYKKYLRESSDSVYNGLPNNFKRILKSRARNYYIDDGYAGTDVLESDVILDSENEVITDPGFREKANFTRADTLAPIRYNLKNETSWYDKLPTGYQKQARGIGDYKRWFKYYNPRRTSFRYRKFEDFRRQELDPNEEYEINEFGEDFSTEKQ